MTLDILTPGEPHPGPSILCMLLSREDLRSLEEPEALLLESFSPLVLTHLMEPTYPPSISLLRTRPPVLTQSPQTL